MESFQNSAVNKFRPEYSDIVTIISDICEEGHLPILLTSRYHISDIKNIDLVIDLNQIQFSDFWKKCLYLDFSEIRRSLSQHNKLTENSIVEKKNSFFEIVQMLHKSFGGNFRALEFFNEIYKHESEKIHRTIFELNSLLEQYKNNTLDIMENNLIFNNLISLLSYAQKQTLFILSHFNVPVNTMALTLQFLIVDKSNSLQKNMIDNLKKLNSLSLIEIHFSNEHNCNNFYVPSLVKGLLNIGKSNCILKDIEKNHSFSHQMAGQYFYALYHNNDFIYTSDYLSEAFDHFYLSKDKEKLNEIGARLAFVFDQLSFSQKGLLYCKKVIQVCKDNTDSSIYDLTAMIYKRIGKNDESLNYYEKILEFNQNKSNHEGILISLHQISA